MPHKDPDKNREYQRLWRLKNREKINERNARWRAENPEAASEHQRRYYLANKEKCSSASVAWQRNNKDKTSETSRRTKLKNRNRVKEGIKAWHALNPAYGRAARAKRRAAQKMRTPPWFGEFDELVMIEAHDLARRRRGKWDVDHEIPLQGKTVSGMHVWNNIRVIPASQNRSKSNKFQ